MAEDKYDKTEQATPRKLSQAREKGQVAKSKDVTSVAILLGALGIFYFFNGYIIDNLKDVTGSLFSEAGSMQITVDGSQDLFLRVMKGIGVIMLPFLLLPLVGLLANIMQIGFIFSFDPITPKLEKINPIEGAKKIFSLNSAMEMAKNIAKMALVGYVAVSVLRGEIENFGQLADSDTLTIISYLGKVAFSVLMKTSWVLILISIIDFVWQRYEREKNLKMSKHEIKEEFKDTEGQPLVKQRIRTMQRQMAQNRMMAEVPEAAVVVTNPDHIAVALKYDQGEMNAPIVVAKGAGHIAQRIKELARENNVPIVENKPLARNMWKIVEIGQEVPTALYQAIAEVLSYVFRLKARRS